LQPNLLKIIRFLWPNLMQIGGRTPYLNGVVKHNRPAERVRLRLGVEDNPARLITALPKASND
jgi:hypothetical protein